MGCGLLGVGCIWLHEAQRCLRGLFFHTRAACYANAWQATLRCLVTRPDPPLFLSSPRYKLRACADFLACAGFGARVAQESAAAAGGDAARGVELAAEGGRVAGYRFIPLAPKPVDVSRYGLSPCGGRAHCAMWRGTYYLPLEARMRRCCQLRAVTPALPACPVGPGASCSPPAPTMPPFRSTCDREAAQLLADAWALGYHAEDAEVELALSKGDWGIARHHLESRAVVEAAAASSVVAAAAAAAADDSTGRWGEEAAWQQAVEGFAAAVHGSGAATQVQQEQEQPGGGTAAAPSVEQAVTAGEPGDPTWPLDEQSSAAGGAKRGPRWAEQTPAAEVSLDDTGQIGTEGGEEEELQQMLSMLCA